MACREAETKGTGWLEWEIITPIPQRRHKRPASGPPGTDHWLLPIHSSCSLMNGCLKEYANQRISGFVRGYPHICFSMDSTDNHGPASISSNWIQTAILKVAGVPPVTSLPRDRRGAIRCMPGMPAEESFAGGSESGIRPGCRPISSVDHFRRF